MNDRPNIEFWNWGTGHESMIRMRIKERKSAPSGMPGTVIY